MVDATASMALLQRYRLLEMHGCGNIFGLIDSDTNGFGCTVCRCGSADLLSM